MDKGLTTVLRQGVDIQDVDRFGKEFPLGSSVIVNEQVQQGSFIRHLVSPYG